MVTVASQAPRRHALAPPALMVVLTLLLGLAGCADLSQTPATASLLDDAAFTPPPSPIRPQDVLAPSAAMQHYVSDEIAGDLFIHGRKDGLIEALYTRGQLRLEYDASMTRNASETFASRSGNCLSLVIMTASLAHELHVPVHFQLAVGEDTWSRNGDLYLAIGHVNLVLGKPHSTVAFGHDEDALTVVDFLPQEDAAKLAVRPIDESTVVAMYMNNRAVETLAEGHVDEAYWWARAAINADPRFLNGYNTLGAIYSRHGNWADARRVLVAALEREPRNSDAMANLIPVLEALGETERARVLAMQLRAIEPNPPFADFNRGLTAMQNAQYATARDLFAKEVRRQPWYHEFHYWLGLAHMRLGELPEARDELKLAMENSTTHHDYNLYAAKFERISQALTR
jgi:Flp pilus assembly protein TadD